MFKTRHPAQSVDAESMKLFSDEQLYRFQPRI